MADQGDADAIHSLGHAYMHGKMGLARDAKQAREWHERAAKLGHVRGMACFCDCLLGGIGGSSNSVVGVLYAGRAAERGSNLASYLLGEGYAKGHYGLPRDEVQAKRFLRKVVENKCEIKHLNKKACERAKRLFEELS